MRHVLFSLSVLCLAVVGTAAAVADCFPREQRIFQGTSDRTGPIAWTGSFLAMAATNTDSSRPIDFVRFASNLQPAEKRRVVDASLDGAFALLWTGTEFGLFYQDAERFEVLQRLTSTGQKIGTPIRLFTTPSGSDQAYDVEWNGTRYVIGRTKLSRTQDRGLYITVVNPDGSIHFNQGISFSVNEGTDVDVATGGERLALVWTATSAPGQPTYFSYLDPGSSFIRTESLAITGERPRIAWDGTSFVVVTSTALTGGRTAFRAARIDANGALIAPAVQLFTSSGKAALAEQLIWTGQMFALSYIDSPTGFLGDTGELRLHTFLPDLTNRSDVRFSVESGNRFIPARFPFLWTGESFVTVIDRVNSVTREYDAFLVSQCPLFVEIEIEGDLAAVSVPAKFTARITGGVPPYTIRWDFGDRTTSNEQVVEKTYSRLGDYVVTLTVTDSVGESFSTQRTVILLARAPLTAALEISSPNAQVGEALRFVARIGGGVSPHRINWDFGDGATATGSSATHAFSRAGSFLVKLVVTDDYGATVTLTRTVSVAVPAARRRGVRR